MSTGRTVLVVGYVPASMKATASMYFRAADGSWLLADGPCAMGSTFEPHKGQEAGVYVDRARAAHFALVA